MRKCRQASGRSDLRPALQHTDYYCTQNETVVVDPSLGSKILFCCTVRFTGPTQVIELATPKSPSEELQLTATLYGPDASPEAIQSKLCADTVLSLKLMKQPVVVVQSVPKTLNRLLLIWIKRAS